MGEQRSSKEVGHWMGGSNVPRGNRVQFFELDTTLKLHEVYLEVASAQPKRQIGSTWKSNAHVQILNDLREFHKKPTGYNPWRKDSKMWDGGAATDSNTISLLEWWATHGGDVLELQAIVMKSGKNLKDHGYIDLWAQFFESLPKPEVDDGSILKDPVEEKANTEEELGRERAFIKTPKGWIPKSLEDEEECTDDSDLDDEMWLESENRSQWGYGPSKGGERRGDGPEAEHETGQPGKEEEKMEQEEEEEKAGMVQREEEMEQEEGEGTKQQEEELEESKKEQQQEKTENSKEEQQQQAPTTVYRRRKQIVEAAGSPENSPDFPANKAEAPWEEEEGAP
ncbi:hypothetical protein CBR_g19354 [Chara braunii]|uniref:Uncharacterized protein n=1 Tax=Chara braunii TaxID=69332 RepID=A0A388KXY5_CHABU|nr:hypothetical protein CBR_g19354 [Chara braunii]|eukprot:GBG74842.1 hypothetical protein CBR_g19354 [Chara braunii]